MPVTTMIINQKYSIYFIFCQLCDAIHQNECELQEQNEKNICFTDIFSVENPIKIELTLFRDTNILGLTTKEI